MKKREFLKTLALAGIVLPVSASEIPGVLSDYKHLSSAQLSANDDFWSAIRGEYNLKPDYINLENGFYCMMPLSTLNTYIEHIKSINLHASHYMRTRMENDREQARMTFAAFLDCPAEEIIITRNTTESIDTVICGLDWKAGDEAIMAEQDYGSMLDMFRQQARRYGTINKVISIPNHPGSDEEIVALYEKAISRKTRLIMVSHMINITGQILPVKKICDMARTHGVKVLVDGAHAVAHFDFRIKELGCDYYACSLHKWLGVPLGAGMLYVKKENVEELWPLYGQSDYPVDDIRKLNHTGTHPVHTELAISDAISFHNNIGSKRKEDRLRFLQNYWTSKVRDHKGIVLNTPLDPARSCAIANVGIQGMDPVLMAKILFEKYKIWTVRINYAGVYGCRITPGIFTTTSELDEFVNALRKMCS